MRVSKQNLLRPDLFGLPEKVLQFGTGVFIRGLIDYFIDKANKEGTFNGRVVMVKSTDVGDVKTFREQDCLYTLLMKSVGKEERVLCAGVSRVLDAATEWERVLDCAVDPGIEIVVSNTTEAGIVLVETDRVGAGGAANGAGGRAGGANGAGGRPPVSFPGKLLSVLWHRYQASGSGLVIVPTELIPDNATKLKHILNELARINELGADFIEWMNTANDFCNSLVDRIVPGRLPVAEHQAMEAELGYEDEGMIMAETFGLWAIEVSSERARAALSFSAAHPGIHLVKDIGKFRELKLRLLNGSHNLSCALGFLLGFRTVREAMADADFDRWMQGLILGDIAAAIVGNAPRITAEEAKEFGTQVLERYRNPYIAFDWLDICVQDTSKIRIRAVPIIRQFYAKFGFVGEHLCLGMAAYILFMRGGDGYTVQDDFASDLRRKWARYQGLELVESVLGDERLWETDLSALTGFAEGVVSAMFRLEKKGMGTLKTEAI